MTCMLFTAQPGALAIMMLFSTTFFFPPAVNNCLCYCCLPGYLFTLFTCKLSPSCVNLEYKKAGQDQKSSQPGRKTAGQVSGTPSKAFKETLVKLIQSLIETLPMSRDCQPLKYKHLSCHPEFSSPCNPQSGQVPEVMVLKGANSQNSEILASRKCARAYKIGCLVTGSLDLRLPLLVYSLILVEHLFHQFLIKELGRYIFGGLVFLKMSLFYCHILLIFCCGIPCSIFETLKN